LETGLDTTDIAATSQNRTAYLANQNLLETGFSIAYDNRLFAGILGTTGGSFLNNNGTGGTLEASISLAPIGSGGPSGPGATSSRANMSRVTVPSQPTNIVYRQSDTTVATTLSAITGPRGNWVAFGLTARVLTTTDFTKYGETGVNLFADGNTYNFIDTEIEITGQGTGIIDQVPIRIIQKV
jgi:hypothetical protein